MELDQQRPYSVLTRDKVINMMTKQINEISEIFWLSKSDATVLLMNLRWDSLRVSERLGDNKENLLDESGLKPVVIDSYSDSSSEFRFDTCGESYGFDADKEDKDDDLKISTPFCSHKFSITYWREYLEMNFYSVVENKTSICCPDRDCRAAVGPDTIEKLAVCDQELYESYILRSYIERNKVLMIKQCPDPNCNYLIEFHQQNNGTYGDDEEDSYDSNMVCLCGHIFCWRCRLESHRPVTCNNASDWLSRDLSKVEEESYGSSCISGTEIMKKTCPRCLCQVEIFERNNKSRKFLTCPCRFLFYSRYSSSDALLDKKLESSGDCVYTEGRISCGDNWEVCQTSLEKAENDLNKFVGSNMKEPSLLTEEDIRIIKQGLMLIVQCRRVLKWCCVYDSIHTEYEISKNEYLRYLQGNATVALQKYSDTLHEQLSTDLTWEERSMLRVTLPVATSNIGNHFYHFIKTLENGMVDVQVKSYDDVAGPFWFCDRCTYGNSWGDMKCKMCFYDTVSEEEELKYMSESNLCVS